MNFTLHDIVTVKHQLFEKLTSWDDNGATIRGFISEFHPNPNAHFHLFTDQAKIETSSIILMFSRLKGSSAGDSHLQVSPDVEDSHFVSAMSKFFTDVAPKRLDSPYFMVGQKRYMDQIAGLNLDEKYGVIHSLGRVADTRLYYLDEDTIRRVKQEPLPPEPTGYYFDELTLSDLESVIQAYPQPQVYGEGELYRKWFSTLIEEMPSLCLRTQGDDKLAAFELLMSSGMLHHLYVDPDHRRKGLAHTLELRFAQSLLQRSPPIVSHKHVVVINDLGQKFTNSKKQLQFWSTTNDERAFIRYHP